MEKCDLGGLFIRIRKEYLLKNTGDPACAVWEIVDQQANRSIPASTVPSTREGITGGE